MTINAARLVPELLTEYKGEKVGAVLRPCEHRALVEMVKHDNFDLDDLVTLSFDCLGTFPDVEYDWRAKRKGSSNQLAQDTMQFARQGGIAAYRYRSACQMCAMPVAQGADVNVAVIGLPIRQHVLVHTRNGLAETLDLAGITAGPAPAELVEQYERMAAKLIERRHSTRERVSHTLRDNIPEDVDNLITLLEECGDCQTCMDACPICAVDYPQKDTSGRLQRNDVMRWLVSCAGCGMCEQACENHLPLAAIFTTIREQLDEATHYTPGESLYEELPVFEVE
jgi:formate dehydrogenase subunit beta